MSNHEKFKRAILDELPEVLNAASGMATLQNTSEPYGRLSRSKAAEVAASLRGVANNIDLEIATFSRAVDAANHSI